MGLKEILPESKIYTKELYGRKWEIEVRIISYEAKQKYLATTLKRLNIKNKEDIEMSNITAQDLIETFRILFFNALNYLKIDGEEEKLNNETYEYLVKNLGTACDWIQECILDFNGNFFLAKK